jgi:hypothetical protein
MPAEAARADVEDILRVFGNWQPLTHDRHAVSKKGRNLWSPR